MYRLLLAVLLCIGAPHARGQSARPCLPVDSSTARLVRYAQALVSDTSSQSMRASFGIPLASPTVVTTVAEDAVCEAAVAGLDLKRSSPSAQALITVRIATTPKFYLLAYPSTTGALGTIIVLSEGYEVIGTIGGNQ